MIARYARRRMEHWDQEHQSAEYAALGAHRWGADNRARAHRRYADLAARRYRFWSNIATIFTNH